MRGGGFCLASLSLILVTGALIPFVGSTLQIMGSFEDLMNERRRLQKELDEKSSRDEYARQLEATLVMDESPVVVATPSPSPVDISSTPAFSMAVENKMIKFDQREDFPDGQGDPDGHFPGGVCLCHSVGDLHC